MLILDTSIVIELERKNQEVISKIEDLKKINQTDPKISFITYFEFLEGIAKKSEKNKQPSLEFIELFEVIQTTKTTAKNLINLRQKYELPLPDLFITSQVLENNAILITKDTDFKAIEEIDKIII